MQRTQPLSTRLRQIALIAENLDKTTDQLTTVLGVEVIYSDPTVEQWGLKNVMLPIGGDMIEIVSPFEPNTTVSRLLAKRGDGGYMIIMQTSDAVAQRSVIPELDSHAVTPANPFPLHDRFSPWHALGPSSNYPAYSEKMRKYSYLRFLSLACRLAPGDEDIAGAEAQWQESFSIGKRRDGGCEFVNGVKLNLLPGREGVKDGLTEVF
ncbi:Glyoxalase/Bleomycin resistance protein/Dihydroxybiphenyl dioxygenase [Glarea lozoyensis ATCC 20868]|uniref:Glyoxalase/Bleomycin resistance protein/Dihydroxybiphenyl dioxygenase n=1 Tax=Glarea lozoyensis (strain ATCC 20868 / MF5171) TaxID=1116229 RepID=S3CI57_GLAL2|nr:Glyoxalase/Bleomycin resistance protein/Dihydroxybiphenyl dioxygenase [Glarea lozoyensis ATCC 20868]EPE25535.1 Glyoxalase/Bleomycin resistance protein/Dihydroxybiphenyl dioxygenase [Glarea lozoyensis ATCC 20868]